MQYKLVNNLLETEECLVIGLFQNEQNPAFFAALNPLHQPVLTHFKETFQDPHDWAWQTGVNYPHLLVINCGKADEFNATDLQKCITESLSILLKHRVKQATFALPSVNNLNPDQQLQQMILATDFSLYQLLDFKTIKKQVHALESVNFYF